MLEKPFYLILLVLSLGFVAALYFKNYLPNLTNQKFSTTTSQSASNWKTYTIDKKLSFKYPPTYTAAFVEGGKYDRIDVYDKVENVGPGNYFLSIDLTARPDSGVGYKDKDGEVVEMLNDGHKIISKNYGNYQLDRYFKVNGDYIRAFYRTNNEKPNDVYEKIIESIKIIE